MHKSRSSRSAKHGFVHASSVLGRRLERGRQTERERERASAPPRRTARPSGFGCIAPSHDRPSSIFCRAPHDSCESYVSVESCHYYPYFLPRVRGEPFGARFREMHPGTRAALRRETCASRRAASRRRKKRPIRPGVGTAMLAILHASRSRPRCVQKTRTFRETLSLLRTRVLRTGRRCKKRSNAKPQVIMVNSP